MGEDVSDMHRFSARSEHGNTLPELLVVVVLIGAMASIAVPLLLSYLPSATANYAARELQSGLNRAKLMAVTTRQAVCVQPTASGYRFFQNTTCTGTPWSGAGTDANGVFSLANNITVALAAGSNPIFNQFGVAVQTGTLRVTGQTGSSMTVSVQASGRVRSEEHTSELQSPCNLVCRLLLEKKKKKTNPTVITQDEP